MRRLTDSEFATIRMLGGKFALIKKSEDGFCASILETTPNKHVFNNISGDYRFNDLHEARDFFKQMYTIEDI